MISEQDVIEAERKAKKLREKWEKGVKEKGRPQLLETFDFDKIIKRAEKYISDIQEDGPSADITFFKNSLDVMTALYGEGCWAWIEKYRRD